MPTTMARPSSSRPARRATSTSLPSIPRTRAASSPWCTFAFVGRTIPSSQGSKAAVSLSVPESADQVKHQGQHHAEHNRRGQWKVKGGVLPAMENVSRQSTERKVGPAQQHKQQTSRGDHEAENNQYFANVCHAYSLEEFRDYNFAHEMLDPAVPYPCLHLFAHRAVLR